MSVTMGQFDKRGKKPSAAEDSKIREQTNMGVAIFFSALSLSTFISGYGLWTFAKYLIRHFP